MFNAMAFLEDLVSGSGFGKEYCLVFVKNALREKKDDLVLSTNFQLGTSFYLNEEKTDFIKFGSNAGPSSVLIVNDDKYESFGVSCISGLMTYENGLFKGGTFNPCVRSVLSGKHISVYNQASLRYLAEPYFRPLVCPDASRALTDDEMARPFWVVEAMVSEAQELVNSKKKVK